MEIVKTLLESGLLLPNWGDWKLDHERVQDVHLSSGTQALMEARLRNLASGTQAMLRVGAVSGMSFDVELVARAAELSAQGLLEAQEEGREAQLFVEQEDGQLRFVHEAIREAIQLPCTESQLKNIHQRLAEELDGGAASGVETSRERAYSLARHYGSGVIEQRPARVFETSLRAGRMAFSAYDNQRAIASLEMAKEAGLLCGRSLDEDAELVVGEALLRIGELDRSRAHFLKLSAELSEADSRGRAFARLAWIEQTRADSDAAWVLLGQAFSEFGETIPDGQAGTLVRRLAERVGRPAPRPSDSAERERLETLSDLHYQSGRLGIQSGQPARLIEATLRGLELAEALGPSAALSKAWLMYSFILTVTGMKGSGREYWERAAKVAEEINDPVAEGHALQVSAAISAWGGDLTESLSRAERALTTYGHWMELAEYCTLIQNNLSIESFRGRGVEAWRWLQLALHKVRHHDAGPALPEVVEVTARAVLTELGRENEIGGILGPLRSKVQPAPPDSDMYLLMYGSRLRIFTERGDLGVGFEALVGEFEARKQDPKKIHLVARDYYVHVAHARVHACVRERGGKSLDALRKAAKDLRRAARIPVIRAHALAVDGWLLWFEGESRKALGKFQKAEELGISEVSPLVLYSVARGRAHLLRGQGNDGAAQDQARVAEAVATAHGSAYRAQWIREDFKFGKSARKGKQGSLSSAESSTQRVSEVSRSRRHLRALLKVSQASARELDPNHLAREVLDELVSALGAERGVLLMRPEGPSRANGQLDVMVARDAHGEDFIIRDYDRAMVEEVFFCRVAHFGHVSDSKRRGATTSSVAAPLIVHDEALGVIYLEGARRATGFSEEDADVLSALANQVPVALELAHALRDRQQLQEDLQHAQKMEAVGRLAGGIAHDFNNMLAAIRVSVDSMLATKEGHASEDLRTIRSAADRASKLTRQLLAFSKRQIRVPLVIDINDIVQAIAPVLLKLVGDRVNLELDLSPELDHVRADPDQLEQVLVNLVVNACDAMPDGGTLTIRTDSTDVSKDEGGLMPGRYTRLSVSDTGQGIEPANVERIFEPFFTTKAAASGTGLGLATVYGIVSQSDGRIDVESQLGEGACFTIHLPSTSDAPSVRAIAITEPLQHGSETILLVEDEMLVRRALARAMRGWGYEVVTADGGPEALKIVQDAVTPIDLVVTDVIMPGMNGNELVRELLHGSDDLKVLYISGYTDGVLSPEDRSREWSGFLQKPFSHEELAASLRELLDG